MWRVEVLSESFRRAAEEPGDVCHADKRTKVPVTFLPPYWRRGFPAPVLVPARSVEGDEGLVAQERVWRPLTAGKDGIHHLDSERHCLRAVPDV